MGKKKKMGRPRLKDEDRRDVARYVRFTPEEAAEIDKAGQPKPLVWARAVLLKAARRRLK